MDDKAQDKTVSIRLTVLALFVIVSCLIAGLALGLHFYFSRELAKTAAENAFVTAGEKVGERIRALHRQSANLVDILYRFERASTSVVGKDPQLFHGLLASAMEQNDSLYAIYYSYSNGDFVECINLESSESVREELHAAPHDRWVAILIEERDGVRVKTSSYLDQNLKVRLREREESSYDPRQRPWYGLAMENKGLVKTEPYMFAMVKGPGVTYAKKLANGDGVVAVDISLAGLSAFLEKQRLLPGSEAFVFDGKGEVLAQGLAKASEDSEGRARSLRLSEAEEAFVARHPVIHASNEMDWPPFDFALSGTPKGYSVELLDLLAAKAGFDVRYVNGFTWSQLEELFRKGELDLLHSLVQSKERSEVGLFTRSYKAMPQALVTRKAAKPVTRLEELAGRTVAIPEGWFTETFLQENYPEISLLRVGSTLQALRAVADGRADATMESEPVLRYLLENYFSDELVLGARAPKLQKDADNGLRFFVQKDMPELQSILNKALDAVSPEELAALDRRWFAVEDTPLATAAREIESGHMPHEELVELAVKEDKTERISVVDIEGEKYFAYVAKLDPAYGVGESVGFLAPVEDTIRPYMKKVYISMLVTLGMLLLLAPAVSYLASLIVRPIKALALESEKVGQRRYDDVTLVKSNITEIKELSRSMVTMASSIKEYEEAQRALMDAFIKLIATAIDEKSPYTGRHCERVPELSLMLAKVASETDEGPFADFKLASDDAWREFYIASWLHDCGKITTPDYIVDKGTKLETIYNRIHEIRMRFEVLWRDAEIAYWEALAGGEADRAALEQRLREERERLRDDFAFVAECNVGGEFMAPEKVERIKAIAKRTWTRNFDDHLGLGPVERERYPKESSQLPHEEFLLADRPEHLVERPTSKSGAKSSDFPMERPEYMYNQGEVYNLCISRGTLTPEDRYKINEHVISTIRMLETLPYPESLAKVPEYAGAHHETLAGTGYPRKLKNGEISTPARILAIADIFEALTAADRPYKTAKKLSESVKILGFMAKDRHVDADLFRLFLSSGVYLQYAKEHLAAEQLDEVDVQSYLKQDA